MSHFTTLQTQITDREALVQALTDVGYGTVEVHDDPQPLYGFVGDKRDQRAHVIIRRKYVGRLSNDIGFERQPDGRFRAWISEYDQHRHDRAWLGRVASRHAYHVTQETLAVQGYSLVDEQRERDGTVRMVLRRMT